MSNRIEWREAKLGGLSGFVGSRRLFSISWSFIRGEGHTLTNHLPGNWPKATGELDKVKERAEKQLDVFMDSIGATFKTAGQEAPGATRAPRP